MVDEKTKRHTQLTAVEAEKLIEAGAKVSTDYKDPSIDPSIDEEDIRNGEVFISRDLTFEQFSLLREAKYTERGLSFEIFEVVDKEKDTRKYILAIEQLEDQGRIITFNASTGKRVFGLKVDREPYVNFYIRDYFDIEQAKKITTIEEAREFGLDEIIPTERGLEIKKAHLEEAKRMKEDALNLGKKLVYATLEQEGKCGYFLF